VSGHRRGPTFRAELRALGRGAAVRAELGDGHVGRLSARLLPTVQLYALLLQARSPDPLAMKRLSVAPYLAGLHRARVMAPMVDPVTRAEATL
jgi:hypothetical protein